VIAASNLPVEQLEANEQVRADLLYRLNVFVINIPPLRERREDLRPIGERCLREELHFLGAVDDDVWITLGNCPYHWPGNARGLRNILLRAILASSEDRITVNDLPPELWAARSDTKPKPEASGAGEKSQAIKAVLQASNNNVSEAARRLGVHRSTIYRRLGR
jgi:transcriptional regulator of acetoin/glycerol metabolism